MLLNVCRLAGLGFMLSCVAACSSQNEKSPTQASVETIPVSQNMTANEGSIMFTGRVLTPAGKPVRVASAPSAGELSQYGGAVVYLAERPLSMELPPLPKNSVRFRCKDGKISPPFQAAIVGQEVAVFTDDQEPHYFVFQHSGPADPSPTVPYQPQPFSRTFNTPMPLVRLSCSRHSTEQAILTVLPSGYYAVPDETEIFQLHCPLASGTYLLRAFSPDFGLATKEVKITRGTTNKVVVDFQFSD